MAHMLIRPGVVNNNLRSLVSSQSLFHSRLERKREYRVDHCMPHQPERLGSTSKLISKHPIQLEKIRIRSFSTDEGNVKGSRGKHPEVQKLIQQLRLRPHPLENGYFSDNIYESTRKVNINNTDLALCDVVYWIYEEGDFAPWHRMQYSDEFWIHQAGGSLEIHIIESDQRRYTKRVLEPCGTVLIPSGAWFAATPAPGAGFTLFSAMLCPAFHDANCEFPSGNIFENLNLSESEMKQLKKYFK